MVGRDVPGAPRARGRQRERPRRTRAAEDVGPYHAPPPRAPMVGRDVPGAPRQRGRRRGRPRGRGPPRTSAPTMPHHRVTWSGATSPARRAHGDANGNANGDALGDAGRRGRRPLPYPTSASPGRARCPRRAARTETPKGTPSGTRAAEDVGPYHAHNHATPGRARRPRRAARTGALLSRFRKTLAFILDNPDGGGGIILMLKAR